jgi:hypothetical protein
VELHQQGGAVHVLHRHPGHQHPAAAAARDHARFVGVGHERGDRPRVEGPPCLGRQRGHPAHDAAVVGPEHPTVTGAHPDCHHRSGRDQRADVGVQVAGGGGRPGGVTVQGGGERGGRDAGEALEGPGALLETGPAGEHPGQQGQCEGHGESGTGEPGDGDDHRGATPRSVPRRPPSPSDHGSNDREAQFRIGGLGTRVQLRADVTLRRARGPVRTATPRPRSGAAGTGRVLSTTTAP